MSKLSEEELQQYYSRIRGNDREVLNSEVCSCIFCRQTYNARDVSDWVPNDDGTLNAVCPVCGMETVIGDRKQGRIEHDTLKEINLRFFGENYMEEHPEALKKYVIRYFQGEISRNEKNESLYKHYLTLMANSSEYQMAAMFLGSLYLYGSEWTKRDLRLALSIFSRDCLKNDEAAMTQIGQIILSGEIGRPDYKAALEYFAKAMALNGGLGRMKFADCYLLGLGVEKDPEFAASIYRSMWGELYPLWRRNKGEEWDLFGDVSARLGFCYENGLGVEQSDIDAVRHYLLTCLAFSHNTITTNFYRDLNRNSADILRRIEHLGIKNGFVKDNPQGNYNTMLDSILDADGYLPDFQKFILHLESYDEVSGEIIFSIKSDDSQLIVSAEDLFAGFIKGPTWWHFNGRILESIEGDNEFNVIILNDNECKFIQRIGEKENIILHFALLPDDLDSNEIDIQENLA